MEHFARESLILNSLLCKKHKYVNVCISTKCECYPYHRFTRNLQRLRTIIHSFNINRFNQNTYNLLGSTEIFP